MKPHELRLFTPRCPALLGAFGGFAALVGSASLAQPAPAPAPVQQLERVEVTGSNIRRVDRETASPVQVLTRDDIAKSGKTSVAEVLQSLAIDNQGTVPMNFSAGFAQGASGVSLRGLGVASTLVLINGRRIAPYGLADDGRKTFTDLNLVPLEAVERIEVVKDGASAIYGSDAVAGVVNVILRRDFKGLTLKLDHGRSRYDDGASTQAAITGGVGDLTEDKYNFLVNFELGKTNAIRNSARAGRGAIGRSDLRDLGYDALNAALGGTGAILPGIGAGGSIVGNVRDPANPGAQQYYSRGNPAGVNFTRFFPNADCAKLTSHPQGDPGGGCLTDAVQEFADLQPAQKTANLFGRGTWQLSADLQAYAEASYYRSKSSSQTTPSGVNGSIGFPGGPVNNANVSLGATHPDNPYFGQAARLRYSAYDVGPRVSDNDTRFSRVVAGLKGSALGWEYDTGLLFSESRTVTKSTGFLQRDVTFALLNPGDAVNVASALANSPAYAALPPGSVWRIGENAGLNSPAIYAALSPQVSSDAKSRTEQVDFRASRDLGELGQLAGGPIAVAFGTEFRRESVSLVPTTGTERGNIIGLGYSAYEGSRNVAALYGEVVAPLAKTLELSAALRGDRYSDVGNSLTPKLGAKWTPLPAFALRGTYSEGFRAPGIAENGKGGLAGFTTAVDSVRCALGVPGTCSALPVALITSPNPDLVPEKSKSVTLGLVWEPAAKTNLSIDFWQIVRRNEINVEDTASAITAGHVVRDPNGASATPGDPGPVIAVLTRYQNSLRTTVRGVDLDASQGFDLGAGIGKLTLDAKWTHLFTWRREDAEGVQQDFAGTHGDCNVTNCNGTPADRVNLGASFERGPVRLSAAVNYRASIENRNFKNDPAGCASFFADGSEAPVGCRLGSFTTVDLTGRWQATPQLEFTASVQNLFDRIPPVDPLTYGGTGFVPYDFSGAVGRFFRLGVKYRF